MTVTCYIRSSYTKPKGQLPDYNAPVVLQHERCTVEDFCNTLHKSIIKEFKQWVAAAGVWLSDITVCVCVCSACVWGSSVKHNPQRVGKEHVLCDEDVVQIVKR